MPETNTIDASVKKLEAITKERFAKLTDVDKDNYLKEINEFSKCFDAYFNKSTEYVNSRMNYAFAIMALKKYEKQNIFVDKSNFVNLSLAKDILEKDISNENKIPYVNGTQNCIDTLKGLDIGLKYGVIPPSILKEELNKWHDVIIKNVDFQKVENAIETKELLNSIDFRNCKFVNCKTDDLEHLNFSNEFNNFIKTGKTAKAPDFSKKFEKPKDRNWKYQVGFRTKILNPKYFHSNLGDKIKLNTPAKEGIYEWYFPKDWVRPAYNGLFLAIPKDVKLSDIICKEPNSDKPLPAKTSDLLKSTNVIACGSQHFNGYKHYNILMDEKFLNYSNAIEKFSLTSFVRNKEKNFVHSPVLDASAFIRSNDNKNVCISVPNENGVDKYFIPKGWVKPAEKGFYLSVPRDHKINDIKVVLSSNKKKSMTLDNFMKNIRKIRLTNAKGEFKEDISAKYKELQEVREQPLDKWNVSKATDMSQMFENTEKNNQPLNNWNVSNAKDMNHVLDDEASLKQASSYEKQHQEALVKEAKKTFNDFFYDFDFSIRGKDVSLKYEGYDNGAIIKASVFDMDSYEAKEPSVVFKNVKNIDDLLKSMAEYNENLELATALHKCASSLQFAIPMKVVSDLKKDLDKLSNENKEKQTSSSKPLSAKGFHDFMKNNGSTKRPSLKSKQGNSKDNQDTLDNSK